MDKWTTVEILRQSRHDWLNKIQLIKGNLELGRTSRAKGIIDEIIIESQHEARLSNLKLPMFSELLLTANWESCMFQCEFEVIDLFEGTPQIDRELESWTRKLFAILDAALNGICENVLTVSVMQPEPGMARFTYELAGLLEKEETLRQFLSQPAGEQTKAMEAEFCSDGVRITLDIRLIG